MKKIFSVIMISALMTSCITFNDKGISGTTHSSDITACNAEQSVGVFDEIKIAGAFDVAYNYGAECKARVVATEDDFKNVVVYVEDETLHVGKKKGSSISGNVKVYLSSPSIEDVVIAGSGSFKAENGIKSHELDLSIAGSGMIYVNGLDCHELDTDIAGSGRIKINNLTADKADVCIAGSGDIEINVTKCTEMDCGIAGSGRINVKGDVTKRNSKVAGSGTINFD